MTCVGDWSQNLVTITANTVRTSGFRPGFLVSASHDHSGAAFRQLPGRFFSDSCGRWERKPKKKKTVKTTAVESRKEFTEKLKNYSTGIGSGDDHGFASHGRRSTVDARRQPIVQLENG